MRHRASGYSFWELLAVISMVAIVGSIVLPAANNFRSGQRTGAEAKIFLGDIRMSRYEAIRTGQVHRMNLGELLTGNRYTIEAIDIDPNTLVPLVVSDYVMVQDRELSPVVTVSTQSPGTLDQIFFLPDGRIADTWSPGLNPLPMLPLVIDFVYGTASMGITISGFGGISSTEYYAE